MDDALAGGMTDGMDCTDLIKNPHFAEEGIWTKEGLPEWPAGPETYRVGQAYTILFNAYQDITGLQDGLYELTLNDLFRPADYGSADYGNAPKAYVYMNGFKKNLNTIESGATETNENGHSYYIEGVGYVPNSVDEVATSFAAGNYKQSLYGLVTDGTMRIGICNDLRYEGCWAVWSDFQLTFRAKNPEVLAEVITMTIPDAQDILGNHFGVSESNALDAAIIAAQDTEGEARYDAMVTLKNAMDAAQECIETYKKLSEALSNLSTAISETPTSSKLEEAQSLLADVQDAYNNAAYDNAGALEAIVKLGEMAVAVRIGESGGEEQDFSDLIVNRDFDPDKGSKPSTIEGWVTTSMNGYKEHTCSYNRAGFELYQDLVGLPKGHYKVTVHTYYRAGYAEPDYQLFLSDPEKSHHTTLYATTSAGTASTKVMNLCEGALSETLGVNCDQLSNGLYVPNGTSATVAWFAAGHYLNALQFDVPSDGKARIGLSKTEVEPDDYEVVGAWNLYYLGKGGVTGIEETHVESASKGMPVEFYNLSGQRLDRPQPGINIVRMSDGSVRKVLMK